LLVPKINRKIDKIKRILPMRLFLVTVVAILCLSMVMGCNTPPAPESTLPTPPPPSKEMAPVGGGKMAPANSVPAQDFKDGKS
jgi:hypothetical protein